MHYFAIKIVPGDIAHTIEFMDEKWHKVYPNEPFIYSFLDEDFDSLYRAEELRGQIFASFSLFAIIIACPGLLGLASFTAEQRTKEIGLRKTHGASEFLIVLLLSKEFIKWVLIANFIAFAWYAMRNWLNHFVYKTNISWWVFIASGIPDLIIAIITVSYQTIKAAKTNPAESLKYE